MKYLNPAFVIRNRHLVAPYLRSYARDGILNGIRLADRIREQAADRGWGLTTSDRQFAALKDCHRNRRAFIIGNGPSLRCDDLDRLSGEVTFACNRIYLAFGQTSWRPTYYAAEDRLAFKNDWTQMAAIACEKRFYPAWVRKRYPRVPETVYFNLEYHDRFPAPPDFSDNAMLRVYGGNTITFVNIQLACYMGIREIYLLGIDHNYQVPTQYEIDPATGEKVFITGEEVNYFHPNYLRPGEMTNDPNVARHERAYLSALAGVQRLGGRIFNAARGGRLEIFPRVDFDRLFVTISSMKNDQ